MKEEDKLTTNEIKLQDGHTVKCYPKPETANGDAEGVNTPDAAVKGLALKGVARNAELEKVYRQHLSKLFTDNAFLLLANRERILNDSRMLLVQVNVSNGLAYCGPFPTATLGAYIEWWINAPHSVIFDQDGRMSLVWRLSGSPLSGANSCGIVDGEGKTEFASLRAFSCIWHKFAEILASYKEAKQKYLAYSLEEVIEILKRETTEEFYASSIEKFKIQTKARLLSKELQDCKAKCTKLEENRDKYQRLWHFALIDSRRERVEKFYREYCQMEEALQLKIEELKGEKPILKSRLRKGGVTHKDYQQHLRIKKKEINEQEFKLRAFRNDSLVSLFPEMAEKFGSGEVIVFSEKNIMDNIAARLGE